MRRTLSLLALTALAPFAMAHEGHGVSMNSVFHYLSAPHLLTAASIVAVVGVAWYLQARQRS